MKLKDKTKYKNEETDEIWTLNLDYNGLWFLSKRDEKGLSKTLSCSATKMVGVLNEHYVNLQEGKTK